MSLPVSSRLRRLQPSATVAMTRLAAKLASQGHDIIALSAGEPDFDTPEFVREAAIAAIHAGHTRYTAVDGIDALKTAIRAKFSRDNNLDYEADEVIASCGGKQICFNACQAVLQEGDEGVVVAPYWVSYPDMIQLAGASAVIIETRPTDNFKVTPEQLSDALTERSRLLFLNSPGNPTGNVYSRSELQSLGQVLEAYPDVVIVSDEIYEHICWADEASLSLAAVCPSLKNRTLTLNGVSKCYAMTGWRLGFAGGPSALIGNLRKLQGQSTTNPCSIAQHAAVAALKGDQSIVTHMRDTYRRRYQYLTEQIATIDGVSCTPAEGAFYAFMDVSQIMQRRAMVSDSELCTALLEEQGVALVPGSAFGQPGYLRLSYACSDEQLAEALRRIRAFANTTL